MDTEAPGPSEGSLLSRTELTWTGPRLSVPDEAARLTLGITRRVSLRQIVELVTDPTAPLPL